jgi:O-antigen ligase
VLVEQGIIGFAIYMAMFVSVFIKILRMPPMERRCALVLMATVAVAMLPLGWDDRKPVWVSLALLTALGAALEARRIAFQPMPGQIPRRPVPISRQSVAP